MNAKTIGLILTSLASVLTPLGAVLQGSVNAETGIVGTVAAASAAIAAWFAKGKKA